MNRKERPLQRTSFGTGDLESPPGGAKQSELSILKQRIIDYRVKVFGGEPFANFWAEPDITRHVQRFLSGQQADGSWPDIDYTDTLLQETWKPWEHLFRLEVMAAATQDSQGHLYRSLEMISAVLNGLDYWFARNPECRSNVWIMGIGRNTSMKSIVLLVADNLSAHQKSCALAQLHTWIHDADGDGVYEYYYPEIGLPATGQNKIWLADIHLHAAILKNAPEEVAAACAAIHGETLYRVGEGLNPDSSFLQHRPQLYSGGYGGSFAMDIARNIRLLRGLSFAFDEAAVSRIRKYFLEGVQWMIRRAHWDPLVLGRGISEKNKTLVSEPIKTAISDLMEGDLELANGYRAFLDHISGDNCGLTGNKHFWRADYQAHRRQHYSFHLRLSSDRTAVCETGSSENIQNSYQSQGCGLVLLDGSEYANIFPCWRFDQIPGVTAPEKNPAPRTRDWGGVQGTQSFVGGVSNGLYGVAAKDLDWDGVTGRKSWFCFDDDIVCLGAGISSSSGLTVRTTLNQVIKTSDAFVEYGGGSGTAEPLTSGKALHSPRWVYEGRVGYIIPAPASLILKNETNVRGDWLDINQRTFTAATPETKDRFTLLIEHGVDPEQASYAYILLPGQSREFIRQYAKQPQSRIIANTPYIQSVRNDSRKITGIVFWSSGRSVTISPELTVSADGSCIVLVDESGPVTKVSVSRYNQTTICVTLDLGARGKQTLSFALPGDAHAGSTLTQELHMEKLADAKGS